MKLISNTSFGDFCRSKRKEFKIPLDYYQWYNKVRDNYDEFLKQPLNIGMFVPCDEDGNVLEEPKIEDYFDDGFNLEFNQKHFKDVVLKEYYKAKEKVLFEGIEFRKNARVNFITINEDTFAFHDFNIKFKNLTIEFLVQYNLQLTENAIKQIGL